MEDAPAGATEDAYMVQLDRENQLTLKLLHCFVEVTKKNAKTNQTLTAAYSVSPPPTMAFGTHLPPHAAAGSEGRWRVCGDQVGRLAYPGHDRGSSVGQPGRSSLSFFTLNNLVSPGSSRSEVDGVVPRTQHVNLRGSFTKSET
jgi:hypothetical protein